MMETVFAKLVSLSLLANWLIVAVIFLRILLRKAPRRIVCMLWAVVALRLVFPFSIESPVSMVPQTTSVIQETVNTNLIHPEPVPSGAAPAQIPENQKAITESSQPQVSAFPIVWCIGLCCMLGYFLFSYIRMRHLVMEAIPETNDIWICDAVTTPFILGFIRPRIYLPSGSCGPAKSHVIAHERSHLSRKDHWWKPLAYVLLSIYWFDPFVWIAYFLVCRDIEFACDEMVISHFGLAEKKAYSAALLDCSGGKRLVLACPVAFGETAVVRRVRNILNYKKPRFWVVLVSVAAILATALGFLTVPKKQAAPDFQESKPVQDAPSTTTPTAPTQPTTVSTTPMEEASLNDEWLDFQGGIQIDTYTGETFTAHVMLVRDPSKVYLATSSDSLSQDTPGIGIDKAIEQEHAIAAVNAGVFYDDGTSSLTVGSVPCGLVLANEHVVWNSLHDHIYEDGFMGFNKDNILIVGNSITAEEAADLEIRDGYEGGPVLMINGKPNLSVYDTPSGYAPRTAIGQREDGTVIFISADGRTPQSLGATYADLIDIMTEYKAVNACAINHGSACNMLYRDTEGRYGEKGAVQTLNQLPTDMANMRRAPTFWMVKP